jgi:transcriptional regulator with XRE-family HTH domain
MTQGQLAAKMAVKGIKLDRASITRIENGKRYLRDFEIRALAKILKVPVAVLFGER